MPLRIGLDIYVYFTYLAVHTRILQITTDCGRWRAGSLEATYKSLPCSKRNAATRLKIRAIDWPTAGAADAAGPGSIALQRFERFASLQITKRCFPSKRLVKKPFGRARADLKKVVA